MIDWHSHILPGIDDGSQTVEDSLLMLKAEQEQGVDTVIATPHFYANDESVDEFLSRRDESLNRLEASEKDKLPRLICGAEVKYYQGISKMQDLNKLCIGDTKLLLLEMSMSKWTEYTLRELTELAMSRDVKLVLAHIDRFISFQSASAWQRLYESGILMQVNTSFFYEFFTKRKAMNMLAEGRIHMIGSDCHNMSSRPPNISRATDIIVKKFGDEFLTQFNEYGYSLLCNI